VSRIYRPSTDHSSAVDSGLSYDRSPDCNLKLHHGGEGINL
jgi:hypothetical protein